MQEHIAPYGTILEAWFPLGGRTDTQSQLFHDEKTIVKIAEAHGKSAPQVILRWHLQSGTIAIPGSSNPDHIAENLDIFDFSLSDEEMAAMNALNQGERAWAVSEEDAERSLTAYTPDFNAQE